MDIVTVAKGKKSRAVCQRSGFVVRYRNIVREPGTGYLVDRRMSDGKWNSVTNPRNFPPKHNPAEGRSLRNAAPFEPDGSIFAFNFFGVDVNGTMYRLKLNDEDYLEYQDPTPPVADELVPTFTS